MQDLQKVRSVFCEALEKETREQREAYLSQACQNDAALRTEVEALLRAQPKAEDFFKGPWVGPEMAQEISEGPGTGASCPRPASSMPRPIAKRPLRRSNPSSIAGTLAPKPNFSMLVFSSTTVVPARAAHSGSYCL